MSYLEAWMLEVKYKLCTLNISEKRFTLEELKQKSKSNFKVQNVAYSKTPYTITNLKSINTLIMFIPSFKYLRG